MHPKSISKEGLNLIKKFEGLHKVQDGKIHPYVCPAGVLTQGYGSTKGVKTGVIWTKEQASDVLMQDVNDHADAIYKNVKVSLTQSQFDALVSFVFNLGEGAFKSSTLLKKLNKELMDEVPSEFMKWNKARVNGKLTPLKGLTRRRTAEAAMFSQEEKTADEGGDQMPQKPEARAVKPIAKSKTMAGVGIAGAATAMGEMSTQIEGLVHYSDSLKTVFLVLAIAGIALAAYAKMKDHRESAS